MCFAADQTNQTGNDTDAPADRRARCASPSVDQPTKTNNNNVKSILSNILMRSDDEDANTTTDCHLVDKVIVQKSLLDNNFIVRQTQYQVSNFLLILT